MKKKVWISVVVGILLAIIIGVILMFGRKEDISYKVTFKNDDITNVVEVSENNKVAEPLDPTKEGYTFEGWYYNGAKYDFTTQVTSDLVLEAKWTKNSVQKWVVSFDTVGGNYIDSINVEDGSKISELPTPTKDNYKFLGWLLESKEFDINTKITKDILLTAKWEKIAETTVKEDVKKYTVTFKSEGGTSVKNQTVTANNKVSVPNNPTRDGYVFVGWYNGNTKFNFNTKITKNITLVAKWQKIEQSETPTPSTPKTYVVTFNSDGGSTVSSQNITEGNNATKPNNPTRSGYTFVGWYYNDTAFSFNTKITCDVTLVAKWEKNAVISYKIEEIAESNVDQIKIFVLKDGVPIDGLVDITTLSKTVKDVRIPKTGYITNKNNIKEISNAREQ